ncbi:MAG: hypothetical protein ACPG4Y_01220 [Chitinophagales bacterium]
MRNTKTITSLLVLFTLFLLLPLYFINTYLFQTAFFSVFFYTLLWTVLELIYAKISTKNKIEVMTNFALFVGVKFVTSMFFLLFLFKVDLLNDLKQGLIVMVLYIIYTSVILRNNFLLGDTKKP